MLKVFDKEFATFDEVVKWAWNTYKIDYRVDEIHVPPLDQEDQIQACLDLEIMINGG